MTIVNWPTNVNQKFYAFNKKAKENVELTENLSGRTVGHKINTKNQMIFSCSLKVSKAEEDIFWNWFNDTLGQTAGYFYCAALGTKLYKFISVPEPQDTNQTHRELSMEIEEA